MFCIYCSVRRCVCVRVFLCVGVRTDPLHIEGQRLPASGFRLGPAQHHVGVAHLAGVHVCGREGSSDLTCRATRGGGEGWRKEEGQWEWKWNPESAGWGIGLRRVLLFPCPLPGCWISCEPHSGGDSEPFCPGLTLVLFMPSAPDEISWLGSARVHRRCRSRTMQGFGFSRNCLLCFCRFSVCFPVELTEPQNQPEKNF